MTALAIYSTDYDPELLYRSPEYDRSADDRIRQFVRAGDQPLDMLVDLKSRRVLWLFKARRKTTTTRTGYFLADYHGSQDEDLFRGFEQAVRTLHESDDWELPYQGAPQWDAGFHLWRVDPQYPGLDSDAVSTLQDLLSPSSRASDRLAFGMSDHHDIQHVIAALEQAEQEPTIAVRTNQDQDCGPDIDVVLEPGYSTNFEPLSTAAQSVVAFRDDTSPAQTAATERFEQPSIGSRIAGAVLLVVLGLSAYSFVSVHPVHPISGLAAIGGLLGSALGYLTFTETKIEDVPVHSRENTDQFVSVLAYGTTIAFAFPTIFRVGGRLLGDGMWLFGPVTTLWNSLVSVSVLMIAVFALSAVLAVVSDQIGSDRWSLQRLAIAHVVYTICLVALTGLAQQLWFTVIPSA